MWRFAVSLVLALALTGCGSMSESDHAGPGEGGHGHGHGVPELQPLLERRDAEEAIAERDRMIDEITAELSRIIPRAVAGRARGGSARSRPR